MRTPGILSKMEDKKTMQKTSPLTLTIRQDFLLPSGGMGKAKVISAFYAHPSA